MYGEKIKPIQVKLISSQKKDIKLLRHEITNRLQISLTDVREMPSAGTLLMVKVKRADAVNTNQLDILDDIAEKYHLVIDLIL